MNPFLKQQMLMQNDTEECIEYVVQEGAGAHFAPGKVCHVRPGDWIPVIPGDKSKPEDAHGKIVILSNLPPNTRILLYTRKPVDTETQIPQEMPDCEVAV